MTAAEPFDLDRFVAAQAPVYGDAVAELTAGCKASHWMWFIFPQLKGLGESAVASHYGIGSKAEARAYWLHPVLGPRLKACAQLVLAARASATASSMFGYPDDLKLCSCMTLFAAVAPEEPVFGQVLERFYGGAPDTSTLALLA